jgi:hypothetical protein
MTTTVAPTLEQVQHLANQLSPADRAQLIAYLATHLIPPALPADAEITSENAWDILVRIGEELGAHGPAEESSTAAISSMRR